MNMHPVELTHTIGFMVAPQFSMISLASAIEVLRLANHVTGREVFAWKVFSSDGGDIPASNGIQISADASFADAERVPEIIICTPMHVEKTILQALIGRVRKLSAQGSTIGSVCSGTYAGPRRPARRLSLRHPLGAL